MYVTGLDECDIFEYNLLSPVLLTIFKYEDYLLNTLLKVENFFSYYLLASIFKRKTKIKIVVPFDC